VVETVTANAPGGAQTTSNRAIADWPPVTVTVCGFAALTWQAGSRSASCSE
jgi:hypothetical protein